MKKYTVYLVLLALVVAFGCSKKHDDNLPAVLGLTVPPQPKNLAITTSIDSVSSQIFYDLAWEIDDPNLVVTSFRVYVVSEFGTEFQEAVTSTSYAARSVFDLPGFGVTAVTDENVEGAMTVAETE